MRMYFLFPFDFSFDLHTKVIHSMCVDVCGKQLEAHTVMVTDQCANRLSKLQSEPVFYTIFTYFTIFCLKHIWCSLSNRYAMDRRFWEWWIVKMRSLISMLDMDSASLWWYYELLNIHKSLHDIHWCISGVINHHCMFFIFSLSTASTLWSWDQWISSGNRNIALCFWCTVEL